MKKRGGGEKRGEGMKKAKERMEKGQRKRERGGREREEIPDQEKKTTYPVYEINFILKTKAKRIKLHFIIDFDAL